MYICRKKKNVENGSNKEFGLQEMTINSLMMHHLHYLIYLMTFPLEEEKY